MVKKRLHQRIIRFGLQREEKVIPVSWEKLYVGKVSSVMYFKSRAISKTCGEKVKLENVQ